MPFPSAFRYKAPRNYRSSAIQIVGEAIKIGRWPSAADAPWLGAEVTSDLTTRGTGIALLAEAPADPSLPLYPMAVTVDGVPYTRVVGQGAPAAGQYRVKTQTIIGADGQPHLEHLPVLEFLEADIGKTGSVDYYATGTVLTTELFAALIEFLSPLVNVGSIPLLQSTYPAGSAEGRAGRLAFLADGSCYFSDGAVWRRYVSGTGDPASTAAIAGTISVGQDAVFDATGAWADTLSHPALISLAQDAIAAHTGAHIPAATLASAVDAVVGHVGGLQALASQSVSQDATYLSGSGISLDAGVSANKDWDSTRTIPLGSPLNVGANGTTLVVIVCAVHENGTPAGPVTVTGDGLTFTQRAQGLAEDLWVGRSATIFTAPANAGSYSNLVATIAGAGSMAGSIFVYQCLGVTAFGASHGTGGLNSGTVSIPITTIGGASLVIAGGFNANAAGTLTLTPLTGNTLLHAINDSVWTERVNGDASAGLHDIGATGFGENALWAMAALELRST